MIRKNLFKLSLALFLFLSFWGCDPQTGTNDISSIDPTFTLPTNSSNNEFNEDIFNNISNINQDLTIVKFPSELFDYPELDNVIAGYFVSNNTNKAILIPKETLALAYAYDSENGVWIKVNEEIEFLIEPEPLELQPFTSDWTNVGFIKVYLESSLVSSVEFVRLAVIGKSNISGDEQLVGAWLDVPWKPNK